MVIQDAHCFACGKDNPIGLHLIFRMQDGKYVAVKTLSADYQGYDGIIHGGILTTMMDEAMAAYLNKAVGQKAVTARLNVRYRQPAPVGEELTITTWEKSRKGNFVTMEACISRADGTVTTEATGQMAIIETK